MWAPGRSEAAARCRRSIRPTFRRPSRRRAPRTPRYSHRHRPVTNHGPTPSSAAGLRRAADPIGRYHPRHVPQYVGLRTFAGACGQRRGTLQGAVGGTRRCCRIALTTVWRDRPKSRRTRARNPGGGGNHRSRRVARFVQRCWAAAAVVAEVNAPARDSPGQNPSVDERRSGGGRPGPRHLPRPRSRPGKAAPVVATRDALDPRERNAVPRFTWCHRRSGDGRRRLRSTVTRSHDARTRPGSSPRSTRMRRPVQGSTSWVRSARTPLSA